MIKRPEIATPVSYSLFKGDNKDLIIENSDCLEGRPEMIDNSFGVEKIFHCDVIEPCHELGQNQFDKIKKIIDIKPDLKAISFHVAYCTNSTCENETNYTKSYSKQEMYDNFKYNIKIIKEIAGDRLILIENNNYFKEEIHKYVTDADFLSSLVYDNDVFFLLDIAHAKITSFYKRLDYKEYLTSLPLDRCKQIHFSRLEELIAPKDSHLEPREKEFQEVVALLKKYKTIDFLTVEYYTNIETLISSIKNLKSLLSSEGLRG